MSRKVGETFRQVQGRLWETHTGEGGVESVNTSGHFSRQELVIVIVSFANVGLLVAAAFYNGVGSNEGPDSATRVKLGRVAVLLGLCSQLLYCLMVAVWRYSWVPFDPGVNSISHFEAKLSNIGGLLSVATLMTALFGIGWRRCAGIWVGATTFYFWGLVGLGAALRSLFR